MNRLSHDYLAGIFVRELRTRHGILVLNTLNDANVIRVQPPLVIGEEHLEIFASAMEQCLERFRSFPRTALRSWNLLVRALRT